MIRARIFLFYLVAVSATPAHAIFKCVDDKGVTHFGDTMPTQCAQKAITEMNTQGRVTRKIDAPLTPDQLRQREEEKGLRQAMAGRIEEQKLKDRALLSTYASEKEFDAIRNRDLAQLDGRKKSLLSRGETLDGMIAKLGEEMEFYKAGKSKSSKGREVPPRLAADHARALRDRELQNEELAKVEADRAEIAERYDTAKRRFAKLKSGMPVGTLEDDIPGLPPQVAGLSSPLPGRLRGVGRCQGRVFECSMGITYQCPSVNPGGPVTPAYCQEEKPPTR